MEKKNRRQFSPSDKVRILRLHLLEGKAISEICEAEGIPSRLISAAAWQSFDLGISDHRLGGGVGS